MDRLGGLTRHFGNAALSNTRARVQRLSDAKLFSGWARQVNRVVFSLQIVSPQQLRVGDKLHVSLFGDRVEARLPAKVVEVGPGDPDVAFSADRNHRGPILIFEAMCEIAGEITLAECAAPPRFLVDGALVSVSGEDVTCEDCRVLDVSPLGFSFLGALHRRKGDDLAVRIFAHGQLIQGEVEVRNCLPNLVRDGEYRLGVRLKEMNRVDALRWREFYTKILDANRLVGRNSKRRVA